MDLQEEHEAFLFKHKGEGIKRKFLQTLWVLNLNPKQPTFTLLEQLVRSNGTIEQALGRAKRDIKKGS